MGNFQTTKIITAMIVKLLRRKKNFDKIKKLRNSQKSFNISIVNNDEINRKKKNLYSHLEMTFHLLADSIFLKPILKKFELEKQG